MSGAHKSFLPKPRSLTEQETQTSFESWVESTIFHISLSDKSARFLPTGNLKTWTTAADRGFSNDAEGADGVTVENKMNKQAKVALLNIVLGSIAGYAPVISAKFIKSQSTSLDSIFDRLRAFYGFRKVGSRILELTELKMEVNESKESLWERMSSFIEDQLLTKDGPVKEDNIKREADEEPSPTLRNVLVCLWLQAINPALPGLVKQRFSTQLRNATVFTIREEISDAIPALLSELDERDCNVNRAGASHRGRGGYSSRYSGGRSSSSYSGGKSSGGYSGGRSPGNSFGGKFSSGTGRNCCLCDAAGRQSTGHFLSACPYLPVDDKKYISKAREISTPQYEEFSEEFDDGVRITESEFHHADVNRCSHDEPVNSVSKIRPVVHIGRVDVFASPILEVSINSTMSQFTLDSGAEANIITIEECKRLGVEILPTSQRATQGDGKTPLPTYGEVFFTAYRGHHKLLFSGLVVKQLDAPVLAGMPFHKVNNLQINYSLSYIVLEDCCRVKFNPHKQQPSRIAALQVNRQTCILPGEKVSFELPEDLCTKDFLAVEPRTTVPKDMPAWVNCQIVKPTAEGTVVLQNTTTEPVLLSKHTQVCQVRPTVEATEC
jgi:hypothetical protein